MMLYSHLPQKPGVYLFTDQTGEILYIGKAGNLKKRVGSYFTTGARLGPKTSKLVQATEKVDFFLVDSEIEALLLEAKLVKKYQPKYNERLKDDKRFPSIGITVKEELPRVFFTRRRDETETTPGVLFFGPFPNPAVVKRVLKILRKIFPFRSCKTLPEKPCLYYYLHLCPGMCFQAVSEYPRTIKQVIKFLKGEKKSLFSELKKAMNKAVKKQDFEEAGRIKKQIQDLEYITSPSKKFIDLGLPILPEDQIREELKELCELLELKLAQRIECFDVSNIKGKDATGSMVVFLNGIAENPEYRKFKIRIKAEPDDVAMIREIISRRLNHPEWEYPDLIVVDGGKGQVSGAVGVLKDNGIKIPVIGLAKREERIVVPKFQIKFGEITLPKDSPALHLLQRIRDEAHRFAISYHKKLRVKPLLQRKTLRGLS